MTWCVCVVARADWAWRSEWGYKWVSVLHAAAINIGGRFDFEDYQGPGGSLCEQLFLDDTCHIYENIIEANIRMGMDHMVWSPFGMGAFLRKLERNDTSFCDPLQKIRLRRNMAKKFVNAIGQIPETCSLKIELCLMTPHGRDKITEAWQNADAFLRALIAAPTETRNRVTLWENADSFHVSNLLAGRRKRVCLVNGANRKLLGNHWFGGGALSAIDENLHRRSWTLATSSYMLNDFNGENHKKGIRGRAELESLVQSFGGDVHTFRCLERELPF